MHEQLVKLSEESNAPNITLQVLPFAAGAHPAMDSAFSTPTFDRPAAGDVVYFESACPRSGAQTTMGCRDPFKSYELIEEMDLENRACSSIVIRTVSAATSTSCPLTAGSGQSTWRRRPAWLELLMQAALEAERHRFLGWDATSGPRVAQAAVWCRATATGT